MTQAFRGEGHLEAVAGGQRGAGEAAAPIGQVHRQHAFERRLRKPLRRQRARAEHEQASAALADEFGERLERIARDSASRLAFASTTASYA